jgi:hypothetical protein
MIAYTLWIACTSMFWFLYEACLHLLTIDCTVVAARKLTGASCLDDCMRSLAYHATLLFCAKQLPHETLMFRAHVRSVCEGIVRVCHLGGMPVIILPQTCSSTTTHDVL